MSDPFIETGVADTFVSGLADIEDLEDGNYRLRFFVRQKSYGQKEAFIVEKMVISAAAIHDTLNRIAQSLLHKPGSGMALLADRRELQ